MRGWGPSTVSYPKDLKDLALEPYLARSSTVPIVGLVQRKKITAPIYPRWPDTLSDHCHHPRKEENCSRVVGTHHEGERMIGSLLPSSPPRLASQSNTTCH